MENTANIEDLSVQSLTVLRYGGDNAVTEAKNLIADVRTKLPPPTPHEGVAKVREALDSVTVGGAAGSKDPKVGQLLGRLAILVDRLAINNASDEMCWQAMTAASALKNDSGTAYAETIVNNLEYRLSSSAPIFIVLRGMLFSAGLALTLGLIAFAIYALGIYYFAKEPMSYFTALLNAWQQLQVNVLVVSGIYGLLGAIVSVLLSISQFELARRSEQYLLMSGAVLPIVGVILATVACAFFVSGLISTSAISGDEEVAVFFYIVLGFLAGFSERFVRGLLLSFETRYGSGADSKANADPEGKAGKPDDKKAPSNTSKVP
jgi:hypothetical protein